MAALPRIMGIAQNALRHINPQPAIACTAIAQIALRRAYISGFFSISFPTSFWAFASILFGILLSHGQHCGKPRHRVLRQCAFLIPDGKQMLQPFAGALIIKRWYKQV